jgi:PadR family transcriptional regulator, regulatory protein PadR
MDLSILEIQVMSACMQLHPSAYGVSIQDHIKRRAGREPSTGSVYAALERLEEKGFVKSRQGEPTAERGGRRKLYFTVTAPGERALRQSLQSIKSLERGLRWTGPSHEKTQNV